MKQITTLICLLILSSCTPSGAEKSKSIGDYDIIVIDSCEYIEYSFCFGTQSGVYSLTHKGNCEFCKQRNK